MPTRTYPLDGPFDLVRTLQPLRRGTGDATLRLGPGHAWHATRTADGPATLVLSIGDGRLSAEAWGPGADRALAHGVQSGVHHARTDHLAGKPRPRADDEAARTDVDVGAEVERAGPHVADRYRVRAGGDAVVDQHVYLAAAAKVTCYTSILMVTWVLLGGAQLVAYTYCSTQPHDLFQLHHVSYRWTQIILGTSLAIAHVGGLLWYELTVYRGVRAIQYASK